MSASVLIIDDSYSIRSEIENILRARGLFSKFHHAENGLDGFKHLLSSHADVVLCDLEMPRINGFKFLAMVQARPELIGIPIILLTGINDQSSKIKGLEVGACDYITKPFDPEELVARVKVHLKIKQLQDELKKANELLLELSITDFLTGLYNRRYLMETLTRELLRVKRSQSVLSLIIIDIDYFKQVNDTFGHLHGDQVIRSVAQQISSQLRGYDIAARFGGEEFVVVLPDTDSDEALKAADRIRKAVEQMIFVCGTRDHSVTISAGVCSSAGNEELDIDALVKFADDALYKAKALGRNRIVIME